MLQFMVQLKQSVKQNKTLFSLQFVRMRLVEKIVTIIWVGWELKRVEGKSGQEKVNLVHLPNEGGVLISTGERDGHTSFKSVGSLPKPNGRMGNTITRSKSGDYTVQEKITKMSFRVILMCKCYDFFT